jgi:hypothetical protein
LAFIAGKFDMTFPDEVMIPLLKDIKSQAPDVICEVRSTNVSTNLIINRDKPPFDNPGTGAGRRPQELYRHPRRKGGDIGDRCCHHLPASGACRPMF